MTCVIRIGRAAAFLGAAASGFSATTALGTHLVEAGFRLETRNDLLFELALDQLLDVAQEFVLVDALWPMSYARLHVPGAINLPPEWVDDRARRRIPDLGTEIVVYCSDADCNSSVIVAERLVELGYLNVRHYAEGKRDWVDAGLELD